MLRQLLRSNHKLNATSSLYRYYHPSTQGRHPMGDPEPQPPPTNYMTYQYQPNYYPDALQGFMLQSAKDPFIAANQFAYENWEYKYEGHWWHLGSIFANLTWLLTPVIWFIILYSDSREVAKRRGSRTQFYHLHHGNTIGQVIEFYPEPPIEGAELL